MRCFGLFALLSIGCAPSFEIVEREDGDRAPLSRECDAVDPTRCLLPWPSNTFTVADPSSATGLSVSVNAAVLNSRDDGSALAYADGFSRVAPIVTAFGAPLDEATIEGAFHLVLMQHDHPERGGEVSLHFETIPVDDGTTLIGADPNEVLEPNADYAVIVTDALRYADGTTPEPSRATEVSLGAAPQTEEEARIAGYHAPLRRLLAELDIEPSSVVRMWDFTTRSADNPRAPLIAAREASIAALPRATVSIDEVTFPPENPEIAMIVVGRLIGMPTFLDADQRLVLDAEGTPQTMGTTDAPFRILVPAGTGDYRFVMYGHGTGGSQYDPAFDAELAALGAAKVGVRLYGWTDTDTLLTFAGFQNAVEGTFAAASPIVEALAHAAAISRAMEGALGDALSADTIASMPNPAVGRRPDASIPIWVGGSLGGTTGLIYASSDPEVRYAVLNVPGAAWTQWVWDSTAFAQLHDLLSMRYDDDIDLFTAVAIGQTNFDLADGSAWGDVLAEHPTAFLIQESIGDPIVPNQGTAMVARTAGARMVGGAIDPIDGIDPASEVIEASGITQFRTADTDDYAVHGFGARDSPAGVAAREQIYAFLASAWAGSSRIAPPPSCASNCDFGGP